MTWINRMVNKQVEKRIAEQHSEFLLMIHALREEIMAEFQEQLAELVAEEARERSLHHTELDQEERMTPKGLRKREEENEEKTEEDEEDETKSLGPETLSFTFYETSSITIGDFIITKPKRELEDSRNVLLDVSSDGDTSDAETTEVFNDTDTSSQPAKCEQQANQCISTDIAAVADTSQLMKELEEDISKNPLLANPSFTTEQIRCEEERVQVDREREEEALLMERQWKEWMDKQEMRINHIKVKLVRPQNNENQGRVAPPASDKQMKQNMKEVGTAKKIKKYLSNLFNPDKFYKWKRLKNED